ncbi:hypothetical protein KL933_000336 [Ogataea haglerorum]|uniref:Uncharacterized protein n=1 Tax=Ogataea haglerorum TaxID=1937702 RepID=A0AAN6D9Q3_9ASCO|nr:hypothetical protein KL933_000336 [Ogataea haglerorum]KAG7734863.1 hypothetical protein KL948_000429 [Ogataea haglerorum]KAG7772090.1 hypothetical protein KL931_000430 [Ogataea haglerorum]
MPGSPQRAKPKSQEKAVDGCDAGVGLLHARNIFTCQYPTFCPLYSCHPAVLLHVAKLQNRQPGVCDRPGRPAHQKRAHDPPVCAARRAARDGRQAPAHNSHACRGQGPDVLCGSQHQDGGRAEKQEQQRDPQRDQREKPVLSASVHVAPQTARGRAQRAGDRAHGVARRSGRPRVRTERQGVHVVPVHKHWSHDRMRGSGVAAAPAGVEHGTGTRAAGKTDVGSQVARAWARQPGV